MYVFKFKERVFFWNILILAWICCLFPKFKSRLPLEIKNFDFPFLDSCLKSRKLEKYSWFLTAEILELLKILDSCLNQDLKVLDSWFLSRPLKIHLALLCGAPSTIKVVDIDIIYVDIIKFRFCQHILRSWFTLYYRIL